jgi:hypothetical protein
MPTKHQKRKPVPLAPGRIDRGEFNRRVEFLRRFKEALVRQRERFQAYLDLLERGPVATDSPQETLEFHITLEEAVIRDIALFERNIRPLEAMYEAQDFDDTDIPQLRASLKRTREEVIRRTKASREQLRQQIQEVTRSRTPVLIPRDPAYQRPGSGQQTATIVNVHA